MMTTTVRAPDRVLVRAPVPALVDNHDPGVILDDQGHNQPYGEPYGH